jgi:hypothetical protein
MKNCLLSLEIVVFCTGEETFKIGHFTQDSLYMPIKAININTDELPATDVTSYVIL